VKGKWVQLENNSPYGDASVFIDYDLISDVDAEREFADLQLIGGSLSCVSTTDVPAVVRLHSACMSTEI
jgi:hypothetical protein